MMNRYRPNEGTVVSKVMEGEAILLNVVDGRYYSLDGAGCLAWLYLSAGASVQETVAAITERHEADAQAVEHDVTALVAELLAQNLLVAAPTDSTPRPVDTSALAGSDAAPEPYMAIELLGFGDMEDLLALDPPLPSFPLA